MEHNSPFDSFELQISSVAQGFLKETAKWALFLSILGFIGLGFFVIIALVMMAAGSAMGAATSSMGGPMSMFSPALLGGIYLVMAILYFFPVYYLFKFASNTKQALAVNNTEQLTTAFESLKSHYKFVGILTIVLIAAYIIGIIAVVSVFAGAASGM